MAVTVGSRLGVYEVTAQIGEGGMGQVYRATDMTLGRQVAIKLLPDAFASDPERLARLAREARTLASLNHPHIAAIYTVEKSAGMPVLVMELVEGENLSQRIARGAIPIDEALPVSERGGGFEVGAVVPLFETQARNNRRSMYDASADGQRFLINSLAEEVLSEPITLLINWPALVGH